MCVNDHTNSVFVPVIMLQMQAHEEEALWVVACPLILDGSTFEYA